MEIKDSIVTTVSGSEVKRNLCRKIGGEYYEMNVDCVPIDGKWYRKGNPRIYYNTTEEKYMKISPNTIYGVCSYNEPTNQYGKGYFEKSFENNYSIIINNGGRQNVANKSLFDKIPKIWVKNRGEYWDMEYAIRNRYNPHNDYKGNRYIYNFERLYNSEALIPIFSEVDNSKYTENLIQDREFDLINKYSFGLEIETSVGIIPEHECIHFGLIPLRDGSISGHEYTTIPMTGTKGINLLMNQLKAIRNNCSIDKECSLHVHFGNFNITEENVLNLYNLLFSLQNELGEMFPRYIYNTGEYKASGKDYCKKFKSKFKTIDDLYSFMSGVGTRWEGDFTLQHPLDPMRNHKWENSCRYYFCNLINILFGKSPKTAEFRMHTPTFNSSKIINWIFICTSILNYAENINEENPLLDKITLEDVINYSNDEKSAKIINNYIKERKDYFRKCSNLYCDYCGTMDLIQDSEMLFETPYNL